MLPNAVATTAAMVSSPLASAAKSLDLVGLSASLAPVISMAVIFAPVPTIQQVSKEKSVGNLPLLPYSSMVGNCFLWTVYGVLRKEPKVWVTNVIGLLSSIVYFAKFVKYAPPSAPSLPGSVKQHLSATLALMATAVALVFSPLNDPAKIVGNMAVALCISMFGSPLAALKTVLQTKTAKDIPLPFTLATVVNCLLWSVTGLFQMHDANIYVPNLIGLAFGLAQVTLKFIFGDAAPPEKGMAQML